MQSDLDLHCPQKHHVSSPVRKQWVKMKVLVTNNVFYPIKDKINILMVEHNTILNSYTLYRHIE